MQPAWAASGMCSFSQPYQHSSRPASASLSPYRSSPPPSLHVSASFPLPLFLFSETTHTMVHSRYSRDQTSPCLYHHLPSSFPTHTDTHTDTQSVSVLVLPFLPSFLPSSFFLLLVQPRLLSWLTFPHALEECVSKSSKRARARCALQNPARACERQRRRQRLLLWWE